MRNFKNLNRFLTVPKRHRIDNRAPYFHHGTMRNAHCLTLGLLLISFPGYSAPLKPRMIYGPDDRREIHEITARPALDTAAATVALLQRSSLHRRKDGLIAVSGSTYGEDQGLCSDERFYSQPAAAFCSGAVVGPDLVLTAGHCLEDVKCEDIRIAFGYANLSEDHEPRLLLQEDIAECREIIRGKSDFALIRTHKRLTNLPLTISYGEPKPRDPVVLAGHPSGLPLKIVEGSTLTRVKGKHLSAQVDAFGGNSGSPITHADSGELLGILVEGEEDFVDDKAAGCKRARKCHTGASCGSEKVLRISAILKELGGELPH